MNIKDKVIEICKLLDELDSYIDSLPSQHSLVDGKICDLLHVIEYTKLTVSQRYRIVKALQELRLERRKIKNDELIAKLYTDECQKILTVQNRQFLIADISKREKQITSTVYKNRVFSDDEIKELIGE